MATQDPPEEETPEPETAWQRRKRLAAIFGDVLPETTGDERGADSSGKPDDWYRSQVPPHHG
ncbi:hypothetical protein [Nocardioides sp. Soil796]|uniref:hypothetical protein n=1 Tax=Nocardioides sp. Soil796 TaxID=1736412 RepID=UPI000709E019|nr:hypothetical protein [Nocardioides sp. Soil796]KRF12920.1 hypothetical protein ASH02_15520 [Nocardioides sp. Soil796]